MKKILLLIVASFSIVTLGVAETVQVGSGTGQSSSLPINNYYGYNYSQQIYLQSEINTTGDISVIRFLWKSGTYSNCTDWVIYLGHTSKSIFTSTSDWISAGSLTEVFSGTITFPSNGNWIEITLDTPFSYNNSDNLVVAVDENTPGFSSTSYYGSFDGGGNRGIYYRNDGINPDPSSPPTATGLDNDISQVQFEISDPSPMAYSSSTTETAAITEVFGGSSNNEIIRLNVVTTGSQTPLGLSSITFNTNGSSNTGDITNANVYYTTGTSFSTAVQFGALVANPDGSFTITGSQTLASGNNYFWLAYDVSLNAVDGNFLDAECTSVTVDGSNYTPDVTAPVGSRMIAYEPVMVFSTGGTAYATYSYLKDATDAINAGTHTGDINIYFGDNISESSSSTIYYSGYSGTSNYSSIHIMPAGGADRVVSISTSSSNGLLRLYGADNITIDGLNSAGNSLTFQNTYTYNSPTIRFQGYSSSDFCTNNEISNCVIKGNNTGGNGGVISIYEYCSDITISNCELTVASGTNYPCELIEVNGNSSSSYRNTNITITGNNLYDFGNSSGKSAISFQQYNKNSTITNNKIYQPTSKTFNSNNDFHGIYVNGGSGYTISGNTIGFANSNGTGASVLSFDSYSVHSFGIKVITDDSDLTTISNNVISGFDINAQWGHYFYGIQFDGVQGTLGTTAMNANVFNNTVGSSTDADAIQAYSSSTGMQVRAIHLGEINSSNIFQIHGNVSNNIIGGINTGGANPASNSFITPIAFEGNSLSDIDISGNTIGFESAPIVLGVSSTGYLYGFTGIYITESGDYSITDNAINYITNYSTSTSGSSGTFGIENDDDAASSGLISNNIISNITANQDVYGIYFPYTSSNNSIHGNHIYNLTASGECAGTHIWCHSNTSITKNFIKNLKSGINDDLFGIYLYALSSTYGDNPIQNNIIYLGKDSQGQSLGDINMYGIYQANNYAYGDVNFNTVVLDGSVTSSTNNTYCFYRNASYNTSSSVINNIFANLRSNNTGTAKHFAVKMSSNSSVSINYNNYYTPNTGGYLGTYSTNEFETLAAWQTYFSGDVNSVETDPSFYNTSLTDPTDYMPGSPVSGTPVAGITIDFSDIVRDATSPTVGAFESGWFWNGSTSSEWLNTSNWSNGSVPTTANNIYITNGTYDPVIASGEGASCKSLVVNEGATLSVESGGSLITDGNIVNNGNIYYDRYITSDTWHYLGAPVADATANTFLGDYLKFWDETTTAWEYITNINHPLTPAQGFALWTYDVSSTFTFSGTPNNGTLSRTISFHDNSTNNDGANFLSNPFPSAIDWGMLDDTYGAVYYWNGTQYVSWINDVGAGSQYAAPMQGFFIMADEALISATGGEFNIDNSVRTHTGATGYYKASNVLPSNSLVLSTTSENVTDELTIILDESANQGFDRTLDAFKLFAETNGQSEIYSINDGVNFSIDSRPHEESIQLGFVNDVAGIYSISLKDFNGLNEIFLEDTKTQSVHCLTNGEYSFYWDPADSELRFRLHLSSMGIEDDKVTTYQIYSDGHTLFIISENLEPGTMLNVYDLMGHQLLTEVLVDQKNSYTVGWKQGIYLVTVQNNNSYVTKKIFIK